MAELVLLAFALDLLIGDPLWLRHPVVIIGQVISYLEGWLRRIFTSPSGLRWAGTVLTVLVVLGS
ncbi:MAG: cobalamin biosynthesis protein, partial [Bacillota bacterium]